MIIIIHNYYTDGCSYYSDEYTPIEYDSLEAAYSDFVDKIKEIKISKEYDSDRRNDKFIFGGVEFDYEDQVEWSNVSESCELKDIHFYTLNEWVDRYKVK